MLNEGTIARALKEIGKGEAQRRYFLESAKSPDWLKPLADAGYFQHPPEPRQDGNYVSFPLWDQSRFLARMAKIPAAQDIVLEIISRIPKTENVSVHEDLLDVALALPAHFAAQLVPSIKNWIKSPYQLNLPYKLAVFIPHLATGDEGEAALEVAREALAPQPDPRSEDQSDNEYYSIKPQFRFRDSQCKDIVDQAISPLVRALGSGTVGMFADLLESSIKLTRKPGREGYDDYLYISQENLSAAPRFDHPTNVLLCATRQAAEEAIRLDPERFEIITADFKSRKWSTFQRLILHLCNIFSHLSKSETALQLADIDVLEDPGTQLEAKALLKSGFGDVPSEVQDSILTWIERGPDRDSVANWLGDPNTPQSIDDYCNRWRRDLLALIQENLPDHWKQRLNEQISSLGEPNPPRPSVHFSGEGGIIGPRSPKSADKLLMLSPEEVIQYLRTWQPKGGIFDESAEGLGRILKDVVSARADEYSTAAEEFESVDPTYVRAYFQGLTDALKKKTGFSYRPVLELATWVMSQAREIPGRTGKLMDHDPDWGWSRKAILDLLEESLSDNPNYLQLEHREVVWNIIYPLTNDPDPTPQHEAQYGGSNMDPATMAINTVRGVAFHCLVRFALWVRNRIQNSSPENDSHLSSFDIMPEVRMVLDSHLDPLIEPSLTIRSIYGRRLTDLAWLDWDWMVASLPRIFPEAQAAIPWLSSAWDSFVVFNRPNAPMLQALLPIYRSAIGRMSDGTSLIEGTSRPEDRLAEHLAAYYWSDKLQLDEADGLLTLFFISAPPRVRAHLTWFIGSSVSGWVEAVPSSVFDRLRQLFEWRVRVAQESSSPTEFTLELSNFGLWFTSKKFEDQWSVEMLQTVLDLVGKVDLDSKVGERLVELSSQFPLQTVRALRTMIERTKEQWLIIVMEDSAKQLIQIARDSSNPETTFVARQLVQYLVDQGHFQFRSLAW